MVLLSLRDIICTNNSIIIVGISGGKTIRIKDSIELFRIVVALAVVAILGACGSEKKLEYVEKPVEELYNEAMDALEEKDFNISTKKFNEVERQHPYSEWANKAQLMSAYGHYISNSYVDSVIALDRFIRLHPTSPDIPYAIYLKGLVYYEQISDVARDQMMTRLAQKTLKKLVARFPNSKYSTDAKIKIDLTYDHLAGKEMEIGRYYHKQGQHLASINRFKMVVDNYQMTTHIPEALHRLTENYLAIGLNKDAQKTASVLGHNFPSSEWYLDSYKIMGNKVAEPETIEPWYKLW